MKNSHSASYAAAGVDVTAGYEAVKRIKPMVESTYIPGVMGTLGGFGGMFAPDVAGMKKPVLVSGTDGVGTKLRPVSYTHLRPPAPSHSNSNDRPGPFAPGAGSRLPPA